jgi:hypothetical protein
MTGAYPLEWPPGWPRTRDVQRRNPYSRFGQLTLHKATKRLMAELERLGARAIVLSSNVPLRNDGLPRSDFARYRISDPGVAVYFERDDARVCMAHDAWDRVEANVNSLALAIEGLRQMERHGGAHMMRRAFSGFAALPSPEASPASWAEVLGFPPGSVLNIHDVRARYRKLAAEHHPDHGGNADRMAEIIAAYAEAEAQLA